MKRLFTVFILTCLCSICLPMNTYANEKSIASDFSEFKSWLMTHQNTGGTLNLANNIIIDETLIIELTPSRPLIINTNQYTIEVVNELSLVSYNEYADIMIQGEGSHDGLIHVLSKGICHLGPIQIHSLNDNPAIIQDENSVLKLDKDKIIGDVHYAKKPVLYNFLHKSYLDTIILNPNQTIETKMFPTEDSYVSVCYQGETENYNLPVEWNINEYSQINPYQYYFYHGTLLGNIDFGTKSFQIEDMYQIYTPTVRMILHPAGMAITDVTRSYNRFYEQTFDTIRLTFQNKPEKYEIYIRTNDCGEWEKIEPFRIDVAAFNHTTDLIISNENQYTEYYIKVYIDNQEFNSNIAIMDNELLSYHDYEGGRGGGIDITPDEPPIDNNENSQEEENIEQPSMPPQKEVLPPHIQVLPPINNIPESSHPVLEEIKPLETISPPITDIFIQYELKITHKINSIPQTVHPTKQQTHETLIESQEYLHTKSQQNITKNPSNGRLQIVYGVISIMSISIVTGLGYIIYNRKRRKA